MTALIDMVQARLAPAGKPGIKWITVSVGNSVKMYSIDEVLFFQAQDKYTRVVTATSEGHIRTPLKELVAALDSETFWQVHRSVLVRVGAIHVVEKGDDGKLQLTVRGRPDVLPVSSTFQHRFRGM
jgi:DNA-binding LytR/AlgR family response regulator